MVKNIYLIAPLNDYPLPHSNLPEKHTVSAVVCAIYYSEYARTFIVSWACHRHDQRGCGQRRCGGVGRGGLLRRVCMTLWGCGLCLLPLGAIDIDPRGQLNNHESFPLSTYSGLHWRVVAMKARPFSRAANGRRLIKELHRGWPKVICLSDLKNKYSFFQVICKWLNLFFQQGLRIIKFELRLALVVH